MEDLILTGDNPPKTRRIVIVPWGRNRWTGKRVYPKRARFFRFYVKA